MVKLNPPKGSVRSPGVGAPVSLYLLSPIVFKLISLSLRVCPRGYALPGLPAIGSLALARCCNGPVRCPGLE